jgi:hypothetical protein
MPRPKTWQELNESEKIEDLRTDVQRLFDIINALVGDVRRAWDLAQQNQAKLNEVARAVAALEGLLPKAD